MMQSDSMHSEPVVPWMPRLQYRAKLGNDPDSVVNVDAISPVSSTFSCSLASTVPSTPALSERSPSPNSSLPSYRNNRQRLMASSSVLSTSDHNNNAEKKFPKNRASSFFNFFSVKEPSQQALEDYQRQLRITGGPSSRDGRLDIVGLPGISSAKLPPTVPKVNSKWDGVPQLIKEKEKKKQKQKQKQKRNGHLHLHDYTRSLRSSGSERSASTTTSSSALSRSSSHHDDPFSHAADPLQSYSASTLSDRYGWETGSGAIITNGGDGTRPEGSKRIKDRSKQKLPRKNSYLQAPPPPPHPPLPRSIPDQYHEPNLSDLGALLGPPTGQSSSPFADLDKPSGLTSTTSSSGEEGLHAPLPGHFPTNPDIKPFTASCPDDEPLVQSHTSFNNILAPPYFSGEKEESTTPRSRPSPLASTNPFLSSSCSNTTNTTIPTTRKTPSSPPSAREKKEMIHTPPIVDHAIAPWIHPHHHHPPAAVPAHQKQKKKSVREIFSGK